MNQTFVGCSMYHIYVSILLAYDNKRQGNKSLLIVIEDRTEGVTQYVEPLRQMNLFDDVITVKGYTPVRKLKKEVNKFSYIFKRAASLKKVFEHMNPQMVSYDSFISNSEINLFHIVNSRAYFLIKYPKNNFRMVEEGTGTYRHRMPFSRKLKRQLMNYPLLMGYDKQVKEVLVQKPEDMEDDLLRSKSVTLDLERLQNQLSAEEKKNIISCFNLLELDVYSTDKKAIILTQPLIEAGFKVTEAEMIAIYKSMIDDVKAKGLTPYLKMHPREEIDYDKAFKNEGVKVLPKLIPIEVLNLDESIVFEEAHTISSGSIDNLLHVKNRYSLGFDYLKK